MKKLETGNRIWFGIRLSMSFGSSLIGVSGLPLMIASISETRVSSVSSVSSFSSARLFKIFLADRICRSQTPPICDADGGLNIQVTFFWTSQSLILRWFHPLDCFPKFSLRAHKVRSVVTTDDTWASTATNESSKCVDE